MSRKRVGRTTPNTGSCDAPAFDDSTSRVSREVTYVEVAFAFSWFARLSAEEVNPMEIVRSEVYGSY